MRSRISRFIYLKTVSYTSRLGLEPADVSLLVGIKCKITYRSDYVVKSKSNDRPEEIPHGPGHVSLVSQSKMVDDEATNKTQKERQ